MPPTVIPWFIAIVLPEWTRSPAALNRMALWCMRFTPRVHVEHIERAAERASMSSRLPALPPSLPPLILLDVSGCLRVNGGAHRVVTRLTRGLTRREIVHAIGSAPSSGQAVVQAMGVALGCRSALDELPFACLRLSDSICAALREVNLTRIGEARAIARSALADRYGPELSERLDMAAGVLHWRLQAVQVETKMVPCAPPASAVRPVVAYGRLTYALNAHAWLRSLAPSTLAHPPVTRDTCGPFCVRAYSACIWVNMNAVKVLNESC